MAPIAPASFAFWVFTCLAHTVASLAASPFTLTQSPSSFWYANIDHTTTGIRGYAPDLDGDQAYNVFTAVPSGDGAAIQAAILNGTNGERRHGMWFASQPRVVYLPPGEYTISETIHMNTDTVIMGDATNPPVLKAAASMQSGVLVSGGDPTTDNRGELSFTVAIKNVILDTTNIRSDTPFVALDWSVAQGSHLQNVRIRMPPPGNHGTGHSGIRMRRGSTLAVSDVRLEGGQNGIWFNGHQQAVLKSMYFFENKVGILIDGGSTISLVNPTFERVETCVLNTAGYPFIGVIDATSKGSGVFLRTTTWPNYHIENLRRDNSTGDIAQGPGDFLFPAQTYVPSLTYGNTVGANPIYGPVLSSLSRPSALVPTGSYLTLPAPNYAADPISTFLNVKDPAQNGGRVVRGDGTGDDGPALNAILQLAAQQNKTAYFPFGKYRVSSTVHVPPGSRIIGEAWSTIVAQGDFFKNVSDPKPVVQVGNPGDVGVAHISDMRVTVGEVLPGAILVQFHMAGERPGDVAMWNTLTTVGGTRGAPSLTNACRDPANQCRAAFLGLHFAETSSVYLENVWNWVADHITEDFDGGSSIAAGRGALVEATRGTWLHGLGSEHWWLYQLNFRRAENVVITMLQSETNYDQGDNNPMLVPAPWEADEIRWGDPTFEHCSEEDRRCRMGYANYFNGGKGIRSYASASWAFFSGPGYQSCAGEYQCQTHMHFVKEAPKGLEAFGLCSKDAHAILRLADGTEIVTAEGFTGSWPGGGGDIGRYTT
ncbi:hypothetical protein VTJ83DRAFT_2889 [Remersonia thermophila]|uniref:Rhamnogalacturonase A/B/Epimerase-like pectate lyase domain-containing protein n=1 Tax=Remersonia thermophila TaxID=72144 RepID=A0ABR4DCG8_9PEZI